MTVSVAQSLETNDSFEHLCGPGCAGHGDPTAGIAAADGVDLSLLMGEGSELSSSVDTRSSSLEVLHECGGGCSHGQSSPIAGIEIAQSFDLSNFEGALPAAGGRYAPQDAVRGNQPEVASLATSVHESAWTQVKGDPGAAASAARPVEPARGATYAQTDAASRVESAIQPTRAYYGAPQPVEQRFAYSAGVTNGHQAAVQLPTSTQPTSDFAKPVEPARGATYAQTDAASRVESAIQPTRAYYGAPQPVEQRFAYSVGVTSGYQAAAQPPTSTEPRSEFVKPVEPSRSATYAQANAVSRVEPPIQSTRAYYSAPPPVEQRVAYSAGVATGYQARVQQVAVRPQVLSSVLTPTQNVGYRRVVSEGIGSPPQTARVELSRLTGSGAFNTGTRLGGEPVVARRMPAVAVEGMPVAVGRPVTQQSVGLQASAPRAAQLGVSVPKVQSELGPQGIRNTRTPNAPEAAPHIDRAGGFKGWASERARPEAQRSSPRAEIAVRRERAEKSAVVEQVAARAVLRGQNKLAQRLGDQRQILFERIARIVNKAQTGAKGATADDARYRYLDLATKMLELLVDEERDEEGVSSSGVRGARRFRYPIGGRRSRLRSRSARAVSESDRKKERQKQRDRRGEVARKGIEMMAATASKLGPSAKAAPTKVVSANNSGPSKSLDIFQAKCDDDNGSDDELMDNGYGR